MNDFVEYWAAARLFVSGGNPYAPAELLKVQREVGWSEPLPLLMWNPPWTLAFIWPFGLFEYDTGQFIWFLLHTLIIFVGALTLWRIYGGSAQQSRFAWLAVLTFAPGYFVLLLGQIGPLVLLGLIGFLAATKRKAWVFAGASLVLISIKPHLLHLVWLALLLWICKERQWQTLLGLAAGAAVMAGLPLYLNRDIYFAYAALFAGGGIVLPMEWATPSLGNILGQLLQVHENWILWAPPLGGAMWFLWYWRYHAHGWDWLDQLPLVLLVSVVSASFVWTFDQIILLPALVQSAVRLNSREARGQHRILVAIHLLVNAILLAGKIYVRNDLWYFWAAPTYLALYASLSIKLNLRPTTVN